MPIEYSIPVHTPPGFTSRVGGMETVPGKPVLAVHLLAQSMTFMNSTCVQDRISPKSWLLHLVMISDVLL